MAQKQSLLTGATQPLVQTDVFGKTMYPHWDTMAELTSATQLDESVIKSWFKIQCIKRRKQLLQCQPSWHKKHKTKPFQWKRRRLLYHNFYKHLSQEPQHCECCGHEPPKTFGNKQSGWNASWDSHSHGLILMVWVSMIILRPPIPVA